MYSHAGVRRMSIKSLGQGVTNFVIVAIIISKQTPRIIKKSGGIVEDRGVLSFTIRDSPYDIINVSCWGSEMYVKSLSDKFFTGDIVNITNAKVNLRQVKDHGSRFNPTVTSPFQLVMSEQQSKICLHEGDDGSDFVPLLRLPTKPSSDFFTLADVHSSGSSTQAEFVDLLVVIRNVSPMRTITTKDGRKVVSRDIVIFDQTSSGLPFQIWNPDMVQRADYWHPRDTADVRIQWNAFKRGMLATDSLCTIITENPDTPEATALRDYARTAPIQATAILDHLASTIPDPSSIRQVMTVQQVLERATNGNMDAVGSDDVQFTALIYCLVTHLDLDGSNQLTVIKCCGCEMAIEEGGTCFNLECPMGSGARKPCVETTFDVRVSLTDHTGSLERCRLVGAAAERVLNCSAKDFMCMSLNQKTDLKWTLLLQRCAVRVLVLRVSSDRPRPMISVLACTPARPADVSAHIPVH